MTWHDRPALRGKHVHLEPLAAEHAEGLHEAGRDPEVWRWLSLQRPDTLDDTRAMIDDILAEHDRVAWAQIDAATGRVAGTTSYYEIVPRHRIIAIGYTWIGSPWQRTPLNTESKLLLLERAFDVLGAHRVTWHTDHRNEKSQRAIERLGATREGVLRSHRIRPDGSIRDTVVYSLLADEWPTTQRRLAERVR
ncbi:GNAT family protein [Amycolatopsis endophytica]|uniref:RimJ/RimL family protein N-acetyltransferase n=1 Tax=Amycolatopsis endophytica TaxID=860233 RepID=A0A853B2A1_9PSEU|nr:GNAT family protein [Amycolatopsis endophytica]NYI88982.1 RimJ/RimL family protein N-acetyltransferase [Amycolatopsis endophytica]